MNRISVTEYFTTIITQLNSKLEKFCGESNSIFLKEVYKVVENPEKPFTLIPELTRDGAHFNYRGYQVLGRAIVSLLNDVIAEGDTVLLVGDSITAGYPEYEPVFLGTNHGDETHTFGYYLRTLLKCRVVNRGISGDYTSSMASRLSRHLSCEPELVILQGGANDAFNSAEHSRGLLSEDYAEEIAEDIFTNFSAMIEECRNDGIKNAVIPLLPFYN